MRALILDIVHGGDILAEELIKEGYSVTCSDVYGIAKKEIKEGLVEKGVDVFTKDVPAGHYDLVLSPVHCPDSFLSGVTWDERKTFHEAVGRFSKDGHRIEVTGVKGKTSCCYMLAHILSLDGRSVYLHTSRGQGPWKDGRHEIERVASIAPTSVLRLPPGYCTVISEMSLGGSGKAEISAITNLAEDYGIAANTRKASDAKASIFSDGVNIVPSSEMEIWSKYCDDLKGYGGRVSVISAPKIGEPLTISLEYDGTREAELSGDYLAYQYIMTVELVLEICDSMGIPAEQVIRGLETFKGVPGRGEIHLEGGRWNITERNPGISHLSMENTLRVLDGMGALEDCVAVLDPVNRKVCEKMDLDKINKVFSGYGVDLIVKDGQPVKIPDSAKTVIVFVKEGYQ